jgi:hypothetical protein
VAAVVLVRRRVNGRWRLVATAVTAAVGFFIIRAVLDPAVVAIEAYNPARTGYLGGLGMPVLFSWLVGGLLAAGAVAWWSEPGKQFAVFAGDASSQAIENGVRAGAAAYVVDGLEAARVPAILQVALARFDFISGLRTELGLAQQKLAERKFVERAKGLLMKARNLSEDEAYHTLRRMAMERNRRMGDVARSVIEMAELLN